MASDDAQKGLLVKQYIEKYDIYKKIKDSYYVDYRKYETEFNKLDPPVTHEEDDVYSDNWRCKTCRFRRFVDYEKKRSIEDKDYLHNTQNLIDDLQDELTKLAKLIGLPHKFHL